MSRTQSVAWYKLNSSTSTRSSTSRLARVLFRSYAISNRTTLLVRCDVQEARTGQLTSLIRDNDAKIKPSGTSRLDYHWRLHIASIAIVFIASRLLAFAIGLRYASGEAAHSWQLLDLNILHDHLLRGIFYLHAQPPLFNTLFGVAEKLSGSHFGDILFALQLCLGLGAAIAVYLTLTQLNVAATVTISTVLLLVLNPAAILYEFDPLYTELVYALHCFIALAAVCYIRRQSRTALWGMAGLAVSLTLLRSSYQPIWLVLLVAVLYWGLPGSRRRIVTAGVAGLLLTLIWPTKNYILFHHFASSTWAPFSMSRHWKYPADRKRIEPWVQQGLVPTFAPRPSESGSTEKEFPAWLAQKWPSPRTGVPGLDNTAKDNGWTNWNSLSLLRMHDAEAQDVHFLLRHDPKSYVVNIARGLAIYFEPSTIYFKGVGGNSLVQYDKIAPVDRVMSRVCCNIFGLPPEAYGPLPPQKLRLKNFCVGAVFIYGITLACLLSLASASFWAGSRERMVAAAFLLTTILYSFLLTSLVEVGENMRFRFETQALAMMVAAIFLQQLWDRRTSTRNSSASLT